jgi:prepilin-type N-terminal cleavage/methylation domain-containing protein
MICGCHSESSREQPVPYSCNEMIVKSPAAHHNPATMQKNPSAFTLIELLVVIAIIAILIGLLFPAFKAVQNQAKQAQAKNDVTQIVNAVSAYYTDYGKYPVTTGDDSPITPNSTLFDVLRNTTGGAVGNTSNPRAIIFISPPYVKNTATPRAGIQSSGLDIGIYYDPWGTPYQVAIDTSYDSQMTNPYGNNNGAGPDPLAQGVIAWSLGADGCLGTKLPGGSCNGIFTNSDDVISWQ